MKKRNLISFLVVFLFYACADNFPIADESELTASIANVKADESPNGSSKINFEGDPTSKAMMVLWQDGDSIGVFGSVSGENVPYSTTEANIFEDGKTAIFKTDETPPKGNFVAYYPFQQNAVFRNDALLLMMPEIQNYETDNSGIVIPSSVANFMVAKTTAESDKIVFSNLFALLQIGIYQNQDSIVKELVFTDLSGKPVSGSFNVKWDEDSPTAIFPNEGTGGSLNIKLNCKTGVSLAKNTIQRFYLLVPAREYSNGFQIDFILDNGGKITKTIGVTAGKTLAKGKLYTIGDSFVQNEEIEYTLENDVTILSDEQLAGFRDFHLDSQTQSALIFTAGSDFSVKTDDVFVINKPLPGIPGGFTGRVYNIIANSDGTKTVYLKSAKELTEIFSELKMGDPLWSSDGTPTGSQGIALDLAGYLTEIKTINGVQIPFSTNGSVVKFKMPLTGNKSKSMGPFDLTQPNANKNLMSGSGFSKIKNPNVYSPAFSTPDMSYTFNDEQNLSGTVTLQVDIKTFISMGIHENTVEYLHFKGSPVVTFNSEFTAKCEGQYDKEVSLLEFSFAPIPVGPIVVVPIMKLSAVADLRGHLSLTTKMDYKEEFPFGFSYVPGGFVYRNYFANKPVANDSDPFNFSGNLNLVGSVALGAKIYAGFKVYGLLNATANVDSRVRVKAGVDLKTSIETTNDESTKDGWLYNTLSGSKVEILLTPSIGVGLASLGGILNSHVQSEALEIPLKEYYILPKFSNCKFTQTEKNKLNVEMTLENRLLFGEEIGIEILQYNSVIDRVSLGTYSGPPEGKQSVKINEVVDIIDLEPGFDNYEVRATCVVTGTTIGTSVLGKIFPAWQHSFTITTAKSIGESFRFAANEKNNNEGWIDINNNGKMESNEYCNLTAQFVLESQTFTVYGEIDRLTVWEGQKLTQLDVSNCPDLTSIVCYKNELTALDLSACPKLTVMDCSFNNMTVLSLAPEGKIESLNCSYNQIGSLNLYNYSSLVTLYTNDNNLSDLNVKGCTAIQNFTCFRNKISSLNLDDCNALVSLDCYENQLTQLDVSNKSKLPQINCYSNQLSALTVKNCTSLTKIVASSNQLRNLDISGCPGLDRFDISNNGLSGQYTTDIMNALPSSDLYKHLYFTGNTYTESDFLIASGKRWSIVNF